MFSFFNNFWVFMNNIAAKISNFKTTIKKVECKF